MTTQKQQTRYKEILDYVNKNPNCSTNAVYAATSKVCKATGRKRSLGTRNWTMPKTLVALGYVTIDVDKSKVHDCYWDRSKVRYHWKITELGKQLLNK